MPDVADFVVPGDRFFITLKTGSDIDRDIDFMLPSNVRIGGYFAVVQFTASPKNPNELFARLRVNGTEVFSIGPTSSSLGRSFHRPFGSLLLKPGNNNIEFAITGGSGELSISSVVIWYRVAL